MPFLSASGKKIKKVYESREPKEENTYLLLGVDYDGYHIKMIGSVEVKGCAVCKLYDINTGEIKFWYDNTNHLPYMLVKINKDSSSEDNEEVEVEDDKNESYNLVKERVESLVLLNPEKKTDIFYYESVKKKNPLLKGENENELVEEEFLKMVAGDPLSVRDIRQRIRDENVREGKIKYYKCYTYDQQLEIGMLYNIKNGYLVKVDVDIDESTRKFFDEKIQSTLKTKEELLIYDKLFEMLFGKVPTFFNICAIDIEVYNVTIWDFKNFAVNAECPVLAISFVSYEKDSNNNLKKKLKVFILTIPERQRGNKEEIMEKLKSKYKFPYNIEDIEFEFFESEKRMLENAFEIIAKYPFVVSFNGDEFDFLYMYNRAIEWYGMQKWQLPFIIREFMGIHNCFMKNGIHIDLYHFLGENKSIRTYALKGKLRFKGLDHIGDVLIKERKLDVAIEDINKYDDYEIGFYCVNDSEITLQFLLFNNQMIFKLALMLMRINITTMDDIFRLMISNWIGTQVEYFHRMLNMVIPNPEELKQKGIIAQTKAIIKGKKFKGAIVKPPVKGVHFNVVVLDFASLYSTIIKEWNLSYETVNCGHKECIECDYNKIPETTHYYCIKRRGILSIIIGLLRDFRLTFFKPKSKDKSLPEELRKLYEVIEQSLKVNVNASYGVFGDDDFPFYCLPVAESTTAIARHSINEAMKKEENVGVEVIYGDTDSSFLKNPTEEQIKEIREFSDQNLHIDLDIDKQYDWVAFSERKKNYIGQEKGGELDIKGLVGKKKHIPNYLVGIFQDVIALLITMHSEEDVDSTVNEIKSEVREILRKFYSKEFELSDLVFKVELHKDIEGYNTKSKKGKEIIPMHVRVAKMLVEIGHQVNVGDTIEYIKTKGKEKAKPLVMTSLEDVNIKQYEKEMKTILEQIFDVFNLSWSEMKGQVSGGKFQTMLFGNKFSIT